MTIFATDFFPHQCMVTGMISYDVYIQSILAKNSYNCFHYIISIHTHVTYSLQTKAAIWIIDGIF